MGFLTGLYEIPITFHLLTITLTLLFILNILHNNEYFYLRNDGAGRNSVLLNSKIICQCSRYKTKEFAKYQLFVCIFSLTCLLELEVTIYGKTIIAQYFQLVVSRVFKPNIYETERFSKFNEITVLFIAFISGLI